MNIELLIFMKVTFLKKEGKKEVINRVLRNGTVLDYVLRVGKSKT
jgi:hypothetical protein